LLRSFHTIVIVTHNIQEAARLSDFAAFMHLGELIEFDTTARMFVNPRDQRTRDYVHGGFGLIAPGYREPAIYPHKLRVVIIS
jgi:phosphate transport system ATP-binding protein